MTDHSQNPGCLGRLLGLGPRSTTTDQPDEGPWPFQARRYLLSKAEFSFYRVLQQALGNSKIICPKVNLGDLLLVAKGTTNRASWLNKINRKHVDFVLCDPDTMRPDVAVELDDRSHETAKAQERDAVKTRALADAGVPLVRIPARRSYSIDEVRQALTATAPTGSPAS